eukprot:18796-Heterococcus_DN1.PRE.8
MQWYVYTVHMRKHSCTNDEGEADPDVELMPPVLAAAAVTNNNSSSGKAAGSSVNNSSSSAATAVDADSMEEGSSLLEPLVGKTSSDGDSSGAVAKNVSSNVSMIALSSHWQHRDAVAAVVAVLERATGAVYAFFSALRIWCAAKAEVRLMARVQRVLFAAIIRQDISYFD